MISLIALENILFSLRKKYIHIVGSESKQEKGERNKLEEWKRNRGHKYK